MYRERRPPTIVVGIDNHEASRDAVSLGAALANALGAELTVAAAIDHLSWGAEGSGRAGARREHLDEVFRLAVSELGDFPCRRFELDGEAAHSLSELAEREAADLLVIGQTHRGRLGRVFPGTLADKLLGGAPCPVAVAPRGHADRHRAAFRTIGVAYDGGAESKEALAEGERLASGLDGTLKLITVAPLYEGEEPGDIHAGAREGRYRELLSAGVRAVETRGAEGVFDRGNAAPTLARQGTEVDLLVIGSHGRGPVTRTALGSVSSELLRISPCPVVVVPGGIRTGKRGKRPSGSRGAAA